MKKTQIDRTIDALQAEINDKQKFIDYLRAQQDTKPVRTRKPRKALGARPTGVTL